MQHILILGAGQIGSLVAALLSDAGDFNVHLVDLDLKSFDKTRLGTQKDKVSLVELDVQNKLALSEYLSRFPFVALFSCLPFFCNVAVAEVARALKLHYFDLTEDVQVTNHIKNISLGSETAFVPQCGLAPGFISIVANNLITGFDSVESVAMRVGALPVNPNNVLKYALTWSIDGLINGYGNPCFGILQGKEVELQPLEGLETLEIDGDLYEAFNTSGGSGSLASSYVSKVQTMNYKTIRYPGHCAYMRFLMKDLKLNEDRPTLKRILENAIPKTVQDVVVVYVAVKGKKGKDLIEQTFVKKLYPQEIAGKSWTAIQVTTAASACSILDKVLTNPDMYKGFILQESFALSDVIHNRFGQYLDR